MSDLLAKCDWNNDELRVELPQWPEVVTVWVNGKAMPYAPVTTDLAEEIRSKVEAWSEVAELEGTIECLKGLADATSDENEKLREELAKARDPQRIGGQADPSSFVYAIEQLREFRWQHATNDEDAIPYINNVAAAHERENAKLRNQLEEQKCFAADLEKDVKALRQLALELFLTLDGIAIDKDGWGTYARQLRELGIEVD